MAEAPEIFLPVHGGWGRMGATHIRLLAASEDVLEGALRAAWKARLEKNEKTRNKKAGPATVRGAVPPASRKRR